MMKFKYIGIGIALGFLSENKAFNFFGKEFICAEIEEC